MSNRVMAVKSVELLLLESFPPQLQITAVGTVPNPGYHNPRLVPVEAVPSDGIYEYEFVADPPDGMVIQVITKVTATTVIRDIPDDFKGVRILASTNEMEALEAVDNSTPALQTTSMLQLETLLGARVDHNKLVLQVRSNGCTSKKDFKVVTNYDPYGFALVYAQVYRIREDHCKRHMPDGIEVVFTFEELGLLPGSDVYVMNSISRNQFGNILEQLRGIPRELPRIPRWWPEPWPFPWDPGDPRDPRNPWGPWGPRGPRPGADDILGGRFGGRGGLGGF